MGNDVFGIDIAGIIADAFDGELFDVSIVRKPAGERDPDNLTGGPVFGDPVTYACQGFWEDFTGTPPPGVELELNDRRLIAIGDTLPPGFTFKKNDAVTVHEPVGDIGPLYFVKLLSRDPAAAVYSCLCRDRASPEAR
jgi:hypothetical protein